MLDLQAFGPVDLSGDGDPTAVLAQPKRLALLLYLALARPRGFHRRDTLLGMFWPELDGTRGRRALSQSLFFLRRALPDGVMLTRGTEEVGVDPARIRPDVLAFEEALRDEWWPDALALYRGDLLLGFHLSAAPEFEWWLDVERERLRELAAGAAWALAERRIEEGEVVEAERAAQRALLLAPTGESPVRAFIERLAEAGDRAAALRFYEKFERVLADELEVEPAPETAAVAAAVRNGGVTPADPPAPRARKPGAPAGGVDPTSGPPPSSPRRAGASPSGPPPARSCLTGLGRQAAVPPRGGRCSWLWRCLPSSLRSSFRRRPGRPFSLA